MKSITNYIKESIYIPNEITINISDNDIEHMKSIWQNTANISQKTYLDNKEIAIADQKDKRDFIKWINDNVFDFQYKLEKVSPMTYQLFYLPGEKTDPYDSKYVRELTQNCAQCDKIKISSYNESLNNKDIIKLKEYFLSDWSVVIKDFNDLKKIVENIIKDAKKSEWLNSPDYEFNYKYSMLGELVSFYLDKAKITEKTDEDYFTHYDDLLEYLTDYLKITE